MQQRFLTIADHVQRQLGAGEGFVLSFAGESSSFVRFNKGAIRQPGEVDQSSIELSLLRGQRQAQGSCTLTGQPSEDRRRVDAMLAVLRAQIDMVPEDPHLLVAERDDATTDIATGELRPARDVAELVATEARQRDVDLVGILAQGPVHRGFASHHGQRSWFSAESFHLDWSLYLRADKAIKRSYTGTRWRDDVFRSRLDDAAAMLEPLGRPARKLDPGAYRVLLAPAAMLEFVQLLSWGGFGKRALETRSTALLDLAEGRRELAPIVSLREDTAAGVAPAFNDRGFQRPDRVRLIDRGAHAGSLISPRSARQYGVATNGASSEESPESVVMDGGDLPTADALAALGTGVWMGNSWYLNYSDKPRGRITGMTRFATFWVEDGQVVAPLDAMRFDESLYHMLGDGLVALTREQDTMLDGDTYFRRATGSATLPGALVDGFRFTL